MCILASTGPAGAVDADRFLVKTTADLVDLCAADPAQTNYVAAIHFCHGFASGAYQFYAIMVAARPEDRFICVPDPSPTRSTAIADFVAWSRQNPRYNPDPPVDTIFRYLGTRYPCASSN